MVDCMSAGLHWLVGNSVDERHSQVEIASAIVLQRAIRTKWLIYRIYGPDIFHDTKAGPRQSTSLPSMLALTHPAHEATIGCV
jgi:hypothetical protein